MAAPRFFIAEPERTSLPDTSSWIGVSLGQPGEYSTIAVARATPTLSRVKNIHSFYTQVTRQEPKFRSWQRPPCSFEVI